MAKTAQSVGVLTPDMQQMRAASAAKRAQNMGAGRGAGVSTDPAVGDLQQKLAIKRDIGLAKNPMSPSVGIADQLKRSRESVAMPNPAKVLRGARTRTAQQTALQRAARRKMGMTSA